MTAGEWTRVKDLFHSALQHPEQERSSFLATLADPPALLDEVQALLRTYEESPDFLEPPSAPPGEEGPPQDTPDWAGRRIGAWELIRELGRGGMGVVWEARRADDQYSQRAAVKLLAGNFLAHPAARFREERQILASLNHPGIARLLDGGTLDDGSPYLVMEYIEGPALDTWCGQKHLDTRARLGLFLRVCDAVEYAHRNLVIHRDLKPSNILVTPDGEPKLLDFGIAQLIHSGAAAESSSTRLLTPESASPEQLQGGAITTSSDIFSLGVLLYILLTGRKPFGGDEGDTLGVMRALCEDDPPLPSTVAVERAVELRGEMDAIVLQALRKRPEDRYPSVRAFADDIQAWLRGDEVRAAPQPWRGRVAKLVRRNKTQSAAIALAVVSLVAGAGVAVWQARVALGQRERAERRFRDVRRFSRSVLFELHDAIRDLPGSTPARNLLLKRATSFLDDLASDPAADGALKLELAEGYNSLGGVQGGGFSENLGDRDAAIESYRKAVRLGEAVLKASPGNVDASLILLDSYDDLTRAFLEKNDRKEAAQWHDRHAQLASLLEAHDARDLRVREAVANSYSARALYSVQLNDLATAKELYRKGLDRYAELSRQGVKSKGFLTQYAFACKRLGAVLIMEGALDEAEQRYSTALAMEDAQIAASAPGDVKLALNRTFTLSDMALIRKRKNDLPGAAAFYEEVLRTREQASGEDPSNVRYVKLTASTARKLAEVYSAMRRHHEAIGFARQAVAWLEQAASRTKDYTERRDAAYGWVSLANIILAADEDGAYHPVGGEQVADARAALDHAAPVVPAPSPKLSPADRTLQTDFEMVRGRLGKAK